MEQASINRIWLQPGELAYLMEHYGIVVEKNNPLRKQSLLYRWPEQRPVSNLMEVLRSKLPVDQLETYLRTMAGAKLPIHIKQGYHRKPVSSSFAYEVTPESEILLLKTRPDTGVELIFPFSLQTLTDELCNPMEHISNLSFPQDYLPPLAPSGFAALLALADLFNEIYPYPDPNWRPNRPLNFTLNSWDERILKGMNAATHESLIAAYANLTGRPLPQVTLKELEFWLLAFVNEFYLGLENENQYPGEEGSVYFVAKDLLVALRCLAWWDLTLGLESVSTDGQDAMKSLYCLQSSVLWQFIPTNLEEKLIVPQMISGWVLKQRVFELISNTLESKKSEKPVFFVKAERSGASQPKDSKVNVRAQSRARKSSPPPVISPAPPPVAPVQQLIHPSSRQSSTSVCSSCGASLSPTARFCKVCGTKVEATPVPVNICKQCGQPIRPGAAFCKNCGMKVS